MKVLQEWLLICLLFGVSYCENDVSSYAVLPYENEIHHQPQHHQVIQAEVHHNPHYHDPTVYYQQYDKNQGNKKYTLDRIVKAPFKALRGAGDYMMGMFDDVRSKFLEFNGSLFKGKSSFFKSGGDSQNVKHKGHTNNYPSHLYYAHHRPVNPPTFNPNPVPVIPYGVKGHHDITSGSAYSGVEHTDIHNTIDTGYHGPQNEIPVGHVVQHVVEGKESEQTDSSNENLQVFILDKHQVQNDGPLGHQIQGAKPFAQQVQNEDIFKRGVEENSAAVEKNERQASAFEGFSDLSAGEDIHKEFPPDIGINDDFSIGRRSNKHIVQSRRSPPLQIPIRRVQYVEQRSSKRDPNTQRTQRSFYGGGGGGGGIGDFPRPILVPAAFSVYPSRLVFPSIHDMQAVGYH